MRSCPTTSAARVRSSLPLLVASLAALAGPGCSGLTVGKQTAVFTFPPGRQEVRGLLVYERLRVAGDKPEDLRRAEGQLAELFADRQEFWLGEWPLEFSLRPAKDAGEDRFKALLRKHVTVEEAAFFLDENGRLCGYQMLRLRDSGRFVSGLNALLNRSMRELADECERKIGSKDEFADRETVRLIRRACDGGRHAWFELEPGRVRFTLPASPAFVTRLKREMLSGLTEAEAGRQRVDRLSETPWGFDQRPDRFTLSLGLGDGQPLRLTTQPVFFRHLPDDPAGAPSKFNEELLKHARTLKVPFKAGATASGLVADFLKEQSADRRP